MDTEGLSWLLRVAIGVGAGWFAYGWAERFEATYGERPMKTAAWGWGLFTFFFVPLGLIALWVTSTQARKRRSWNLREEHTASDTAWNPPPVQPWQVAPPGPVTAPASRTGGSTAPGMTILPGSPPPQ